MKASSAVIYELAVNESEFCREKKKKKKKK